MSDLEIIPQHEPEIIAAAARKHWRGDDEKVATTSIEVLIVHDVEITSRYQKAHEFELMRDMILAMPRPCGALKSIFCDSKATYCFSVVLRYWNVDLARAIAAHLEKAATAYVGGHNGITVSADGGEKFGMFGDPHRSVYLCPHWENCE